MKKLNLLLTTVATIGLTAATMAQVPNYVPTNGLVGWWPFNGNANDESGNGNNGTTQGSVLPTSDRFGSVNSAYSFPGNSSSYIKVNNSTSLQIQNSLSISAWFYMKDGYINPRIIHFGNGSSSGYSIAVQGSSNVSRTLDALFTNIGGSGVGFCCGSGGTGITVPALIWQHVVFTVEPNGLAKLFINGLLAATATGTAISNAQYTTDLNIGRLPYPAFDAWGGKLDDIGIWDRALTQQEVTALYNASNCANNTAITPQTNSLSTGGTATFTTSTSDPNPSYIWQSDYGQGFQTLNNVGNYSGTKTNKLSISNVQLRNHMQPFRVISTSGNCIDTSNVANIMITDTCILTKTDTIHISVTDTLIINTKISGITPPGNTNTIKVFPNPTYDHITINYGNFAIMSGYQLKIENSLGQQVFQTNITQPSNYLSLATWGGKGLYIIKIINPQGNTIEIRKIILQ